MSKTIILVTSESFSFLGQKRATAQRMASTMASTMATAHVPLDNSLNAVEQPSYCWGIIS